MVAFGGDVENRLRAKPAQAFLLELREMISQCRQERRVICYRAARSKRAVRTQRVITKTRAQRANQVLLHLNGERVVLPDGKLRIESGYQSIGWDSHCRRSRIEKAVIARMRRVDLRLSKRLGREANRFRGRHRPREIHARKQSTHEIRRRVRGNRKVTNT